MLQAIKNKKIILAVVGVIIIVAAMAAGIYWRREDKCKPCNDPLSDQKIFDPKTVLEQVPGSAEMQKFMEGLKKNEIPSDTYR